MNLRAALHNARIMLREHGIEDAALESEVLLRYQLGIDRTFLYTAPEKQLSPEDYEQYLILIKRRYGGEPTAYITGKKEFYGREFTVNSSVLIPRPETELLVEFAVRLAGERACRSIADIGTGSGCIAVSLAFELPEVKLYATDTSPEALDIARYNSRRHGVEERIVFLQGHLLEPLNSDMDMIVANLPYIDEEGMKIVNTLGFEPLSALYGGGDGLQVIVELIRQAKTRLSRKGTLLLEIGKGQLEACRQHLEEAFPDAETLIFKDLAGIERVIGTAMSSNSRSFS